jgi:hypothetical protein
MARCPDCNKYTGIDSESDPNVDDLSVNDTDGTVSVQMTIENNCAECSTTLYTADLSGDVDASDIADSSGLMLAALIEKIEKEGGTITQMEVEEDGSSRTDRFEGKGRGQRHFYGAEIQFTVTVTWTDADPEDEETEAKEHEARFSGSYSEDMQASAMDQQF